MWPENTKMASFELFFFLWMLLLDSAFVEQLAWHPPSRTVDAVKMNQHEALSLQ